MERILATECLSKIGEKVLLKGWAANIRDHGSLIFITFRDWSGPIQIVINPSDAPEAHALAQTIGREWVISVEGTVVKRDEGLINKDLETGTIEIACSTIEVVNKSLVPPFMLDTDGRDIDENLRLKYRYIDMRRERIAKIMKARHKLILAVRNWMDKSGFIEVQTPLLTSTSPEGARDFIIPSRVHKGKFFVLPQAPQQFKQLMMVGGVNKYFQIAPCMRDEDPRADRHAGAFYQIDMEMSFPTREKIFETCENLINETYQTVTSSKRIKEFPFPQISFVESMDRFGSDKPDLRFGLELKELTEVVHGKTEFKIFSEAGTVKCVVAEGCGEWSRKEIDAMEEHAKEKGAKGLAYGNVVGETLESGVSKFFTPEVQKEMISVAGAKSGDLLFFGAGKRSEVNKILGAVRLKLGEILNLADPDELAFAWITDFPFYELNEETGKLDFGHNPFSMPKGGMDAFKAEDPLTIESYQYDLALNGYEMLSGSIRNHEPETLVKAFETIGYSRDEVLKRFGGMYNAFQYGAPPHGGWAIGFDRLLMVLIDEPNIRDVYAFPKNSNGVDVMMDAPSVLDEIQLQECGIMLRPEVVKALRQAQGPEKRSQQSANGEPQAAEEE